MELFALKFGQALHRVEVIEVARLLLEAEAAGKQRLQPLPLGLGHSHQTEGALPLGGIRRQDPEGLGLVTPAHRPEVAVLPETGNLNGQPLAQARDARAVGRPPHEQIGKIVVTGTLRLSAQ
ncbi:hypothetical protein SDC9_124597 [bioreactor metagenome]|uniref:Uncharacterized protein n=1 Tax=bioreactor metagenome TaxID=1076179 RepID=A0A645CKW2_9ZZZZ